MPAVDSSALKRKVGDHVGPQFQIAPSVVQYKDAALESQPVDEALLFGFPLSVVAQVAQV